MSGVLIDTSATREAARIDMPSQSKLMTWTRFSGGRRFMLRHFKMTLCLTDHAYQDEWNNLRIFRVEFRHWLFTPIGALCL